MHHLKRQFSSKRVCEPTAPSGIPLRRIFQPVFPLSLRESIRQWTQRGHLRQAEEALLDCVGLNPSNPQNDFTSRSLDVPVTPAHNSVARRWEGRQLTINELEVTKAGALTQKHVVFLHGYGASKGYFFRNFKKLAEHHSIHALDWLGYGLSTRPTPNLPKFAKLSEAVKYGERWFLEPFESWRQNRNIEKVTIVAHSLGAYLACLYASMNPEKVEKLVLVSPASVNRTSASIPIEVLYSNLNDPERDQISAPLTGIIPEVPRWFQRLWELHWSPFALVRNSGPLGPKLTSGWTSRRFSRLPVRAQEALQDYSYRMFNAAGSGEYLLNYFLASGGLGRWPVVERLAGLQCPTLWLYGSHDWMDVAGGEEAVRRLRARGLEAEIQTLENSGHHLYLDNELAFCEAVLRFIR